ncbi:MAG: nicotinate phosphoribosyltransferase, partial [Pseudomonadota bacterium]
ADGRMAGDMLTIETDRQDGAPLIHPVMRAGRRLAPSESLDAIRARVAQELMRLPEQLRALDAKPSYPVTIAPALENLAHEVDQRMHVN